MLKRISSTVVKQNLYSGIRAAEACAFQTPVSGRDLVGNKIDVELSSSFSIREPFSISAGIKFTENTMEASDEFVTEFPLRQAITNQIAKEPEVSEVVWRETTGVVELGLPVSGSVPLCELSQGFGVSLDYGFDPRSLLCYRFSKPLRRYPWPKRDSSYDERIESFPLTAQKAAQLNIGHEVELCGVGTLQLTGGLTVTEGVGVMGLAKAGIGASLAAAHTRSGAYGLAVMALNGGSVVRVTVRTIDEQINELNLNLRAGILNVASVPLPSFGEGALPELLENGEKRVIKSLIADYGSVVARVGASSAQKDSIICCYDLDLSKEAAQKAYYELLRLRPVKADKMAADENSGVLKVRVKEHEHRSSRSSDFKALNQQLYLRESADIDHDGMVIKENGARLLYRDKIHAEKSSNFITGTQEIQWEGITVKDSQGELHTYYRFFYERQNNLPKQSDVDHYFGLARRLGITSTVKEKLQLIAMTTLEKLFSRDDDIKATIEIFFTEEGVLRIQSADAAMGFEAFLEANLGAVLGAFERARANDLLDQYQQLSSSWWAFFGGTREMEDIIASYEAEFQRSFFKDYEVFEKAKKFGEFVGRFSNVNSSKRARRFFTVLGSSNAFDYSEVLAALALLAERKNLLVHNLSLSGGDVLIKSADEGQIIHPRDELRRAFARNAPPRLAINEKIDSLTSNLA